jgi:hypothetical protein
MTADATITLNIMKLAFLKTILIIVKLHFYTNLTTEKNSDSSLKLDGKIRN